jgi:hypothetical protein
MKATWIFRAARMRSEYAWIRRACGRNTIEGSEHDALEFARRATEHLRMTSVSYVEAWSVGAVIGSLELPDLVTFRIVPHENGKDWRALENCLHHGGWYKPNQLQFAIDYAFFRGGGKLCAVEVLAKDKGRKSQDRILKIILADQTGQYAGLVKPVGGEAKCLT